MDFVSVTIDIIILFKAIKKMVFTMVVTLLLFLCICICNSQDPCMTNYTIPRASYRGGKCSYTGIKFICDSTLTSAWYRAPGLTGDLMMPEQPPNPKTCGTDFPYWMNGSHPSTVNTEVGRIACQKTIHSTCKKQVNIRVKNCGTYYVYKLSALDACPEAYCFGENEPCPPFDPCDVYEYTKIEHKTGGACKQHGKCTRFNPTNWYAFIGLSPFDVLGTTALSSTDNECPDQEHSYLKGNDLTSSNGTKLQPVCVQTATDPCSSQLNIEYKTCSSALTVYKFPTLATTSCKQYCLDTETKRWSMCPIVKTGCPGCTTLGSNTLPDFTTMYKIAHSTGHDNNDNTRTYIIAFSTVGGVIVVGSLVVAAIWIIKRPYKAVSDLNMRKTPPPTYQESIAPVESTNAVNILNKKGTVNHTK